MLNMYIREVTTSSAKRYKLKKMIFSEILDRIDIFFFMKFPNSRYWENFFNYLCNIILNYMQHLVSYQHRDLRVFVRLVDRSIQMESCDH